MTKNLFIRIVLYVNFTDLNSANFINSFKIQNESGNAYFYLLSGGHLISTFPLSSSPRCIRTNFASILAGITKN